MVETGWTLIPKPPLLSITVKSHSDPAVDTVNDLQIYIVSMGKLIEKIWAIGYLLGSQYRTNHIVVLTLWRLHSILHCALILKRGHTRRACRNAARVRSDKATVGCTGEQPKYP